MMIRLLLLISLSGCAATTNERITDIEQSFKGFVSDCQFTEGHLYVPRRRIHNAPPTPWEMLDAVCFYEGTFSYTFREEFES